jgi:acetate kinase
LQDNIELAPLHNPPNIKGIQAVKRIMPDTPQCGVFDTAFHLSMPPEAFFMEYHMNYIKSIKSEDMVFMELHTGLYQ